MKNNTLYLVLISTVTLCFSVKISSQNYDYVHEDYGETKDRQLVSNENIIIPLYDIKYESETIPIYLTYDNKGLKAGSIPSSIGYNWNLHAGGKIHREVRNKEDDTKNGWFYDNYVENLQSGILSTTVTSGNPTYRNTDVAPDIYKMSLSNGDHLEYFYERTLDINRKVKDLNQITINSNQDYFVFTNFERTKYFLERNYLDNSNYEYADQGDIVIQNKAGKRYIFRKGEDLVRPWSLKKKLPSYRDSTFTKDYYLHKIKNIYNNDDISFEYITSKASKFIYYHKSARVQTNQEPQTPPQSSDEIISQGIYKDISVEDITRKEISKITTPTETVEFIYETYDFFSGFDTSEYIAQNIPITDIQNQKIKLLKAIHVFDHNSNYILGYEFNYTSQPTNQEEFEGLFRLKSIYRIGKNKKDNILFNEFEYYANPSPNICDDHAVDVFGYPNGASSNNQLTNLAPIKIHDFENAPDRTPNKSVMEKGMLKAIKNAFGGYVEYSYKENSYNHMYFGGLLVESIKTFDSNSQLIAHKTFEYDAPEGLGLPIYEDWVLAPGSIPNHLYQNGYFEIFNQGVKGWHSYFTLRNPFMNNTHNAPLKDYNIYSYPYELMRHTPRIDQIASQLGIQGGIEQLKGGIIYKKIIEKNLNINSGQTEKGYSISYYEPTIGSSSISKILTKRELYNNSNKLVSEEIFNYDAIHDSSFRGHRWNNMHINSGSYPLSSYYRYRLQEDHIYKIRHVLQSLEKKLYDNETNSLIKSDKKEYTYLYDDFSGNYDYFKVKGELQYSNNVLTAKNTYKYFTEFENIEQGYLYMLNPIVLECKWVKSNNEWKLQNAIINDYDTNGILRKLASITGNHTTKTYYTESNFNAPFYNTSGDLIYDSENVTSYHYDDKWRLSATKNPSQNAYTFFQRSDEYDGFFIDAVLNSKLDDNQFLKKSFENSNEPNTIYLNNAFSGSRVFNGNSINLGVFPNNTSVSFWSYENNIWKYNTFTHSGGTLHITKPQNALYLDELRIQPKHTSLQSFTLVPGGRKSSILDDRGHGKRIEYDVFNRPLYILDKQGNVLKEFHYNNSNID